MPVTLASCLGLTSDAPSACPHDYKQPFDPTADSPTDFSVPADQRPLGGLGIMYLHQMTDGLAYQRVDGHNVLKIIKTIHKK